MREDNLTLVSSKIRILQSNPQTRETRKEIERLTRILTSLKSKVSKC